MADDEGLYAPDLGEDHDNGYGQHGDMDEQQQQHDDEQRQQEERNYIADYMSLFAAKKMASESPNSGAAKRHRTDKKAAQDAIQSWMVKRGNIHCCISLQTPALIRYTSFHFTYEFPVRTLEDIVGLMRNPAEVQRMITQLQRHAYIIEVSHEHSETIRDEISMAHFFARTLFDHIADKSAALKAKFKIDASAPSAPSIADIEGLLEEEDDGDHDENGEPVRKVPGNAAAGGDLSAARQVINSLKIQNLEREVVHCFTDASRFKVKEAQKLLQRYDCLMPVALSLVAPTPVPFILNQYLLESARKSIDAQKDLKVVKASGMTGRQPAETVFAQTAATPFGELALDSIAIGDDERRPDLVWLRKKLIDYCHNDDKIDQLKTEAKAMASAKKIDLHRIARKVTATPDGADAHLYWETKSKDKEFEKALKANAEAQLIAAPVQQLSKMNPDTQSRSVVKKLDPVLAAAVGGGAASASIKGATLKIDDRIAWATLAQTLIDVCCEVIPPGPFTSSQDALNILDANLLVLTDALEHALVDSCQENAAFVDTSIKLTIQKESKSEKIFRRRARG